MFASSLLHAAKAALPERIPNISQNPRSSAATACSSCSRAAIRMAGPEKNSACSPKAVSTARSSQYPSAGSWTRAGLGVAVLASVIQISLGNQIARTGRCSRADSLQREQNNPRRPTSVRKTLRISRLARNTRGDRTELIGPVASRHGCKAHHNQTDAIGDAAAAVCASAINLDPLNISASRKPARCVRRPA
jgi:hypothetical protein